MRPLHFSFVVLKFLVRNLGLLFVLTLGHFFLRISGARLDVLVGWETLTEIFDVHSYIGVRNGLQRLLDLTLLDQTLVDQTLVD
jgi:hypothetical protein